MVPQILVSLVNLAVTEMDRLMPFLGELEKTPTKQLPLLNLRDLMSRPDLLPGDDPTE